MLISPLMGPIVGVGAGLGVMDLALVRRSLNNVGFAVLASLATSTLYFLISPLTDSYSEILARTSPFVGWVLIALCGGFAGIIATTSKDRGNVVPGVAIATALMPPLCTAGYGLANLNWPFFFGALYLFIINSVFISLAALFTVRWLGYPMKRMEGPIARQVKRVTGMIVLLTVIPSVYLAYRLVVQNGFEHAAARYIEYDSVVPNNYLADHSVDAKRRTVSLPTSGMGSTHCRDHVASAAGRPRASRGTAGDPYRTVLTGTQQDALLGSGGCEQPSAGAAGDHDAAGGAQRQLGNR
ncbi:MAG: DUF389 domain-containing protein [Flavobacteriales bacterium]|nr:DUF389 domain-containing protein [Flavobacteriales bacterium]